MVHRRAETRQGRCWRAAMGAAVALAAAVPGGVAFAEDSRAPAPWPGVAPTVIARDLGPLALCTLAVAPGCAGAGAAAVLADLAPAIAAHRARPGTASRLSSVAPEPEPAPSHQSLASTGAPVSTALVGVLMLAAGGAMIRVRTAGGSG